VGWRLYTTRPACKHTWVSFFIPCTTCNNYGLVLFRWWLEKSAWTKQRSQASNFGCLGQYFLPSKATPVTFPSIQA
jgi:hypothetical protein